MASSYNFIFEKKKNVTSFNSISYPHVIVITSRSWSKFRILDRLCFCAIPHYTKCKHSSVNRWVALPISCFWSGLTILSIFLFFFFSKWHPWTKIIFKNEILRVPSFRSLVTQYYWRRKTLHQTQLISLLGSKAIRFKIHHACQSLVPIWRPFCITDWHREGLNQNTKNQIHARYSTHTFK